MAVKKYRYSDEIQITEHFNSREWRCKPDSQHNVQHDYYIDTDL